MRKLDIKAVDFALVDVSGLDPIETKFVDMNKVYVDQERNARKLVDELERIASEIKERQTSFREIGMNVVKQTMRLHLHGDLLNDFANTLDEEQLERVKERLLAAQPDAPTSDAPTSDAPTSDAPTQ